MSNTSKQSTVSIPSSAQRNGSSLTYASSPSPSTYVNHLSQTRFLAPKIITCYISGLSRLLCYVRASLSKLACIGCPSDRMELNLRLQENALKLQPLYTTLTKLNKPIVQKRTASYNTDIIVAMVRHVDNLFFEENFLAAIELEMDRLSLFAETDKPSPLELATTSSSHHFCHAHMQVQAYVFSFLCISNCWRVSSLTRLHVFDLFTVETVQDHQLVNCSDHKHGSSGQLVIPDRIYRLLVRLISRRIGKTLVDTMKSCLVVYLRSTCSKQDELRRQFPAWVFVTRSGCMYGSGKGLELIRATLKFMCAHLPHETAEPSVSTTVSDIFNSISGLPDHQLMKLCTENLTTRQVRVVSMNMANKVATSMAELNHLDQHLGHTPNTR